MRSLDLAVIALYALAMLAVGRYYKLRVQTADDYLLGGRTMSPFMIGLSLAWPVGRRSASALSWCC